MEIFLKRIWNINNLTSDTMLKWKDMRISYIRKNLEDMRSIADIPKLCSMPGLAFFSSRPSVTSI